MVVDYNKLSIDKEDSFVQYNDELHKYWTKGSKLECVSVTTLIHKFSTFDEAFWSAYKTLESLISTDKFLTVKGALLDTKNFSIKYLDNFGIDHTSFEMERQALLADWDRKREESCIRGTAIHREHEMLHLAGKTKELETLKLGGLFKPITSNKIELGVQGVYPELLLSRISDDGKLRIAGQADLVIVDGKDIYILDYKTSKKIETKSFFDKKTRKHECLKYPLNNLHDTNFWHYTLQLSTYAWLIEKINPDFNIKVLMIIHYDHDGNVVPYQCEYLKSDVERMLAYYKKELEHEEFKRSREKIIF